ncbi:hypothetical protein GJ744_009361 [Endocarpon pusillum]|uniref:Uncharacterized protein n=1 Tax=Endocarpon pusillum TaxID=364733 RepID=A0A8H7ANM9_9EURO|nr:hypothetical protein GJ744_009361 [Endocarpon pusillum]
MKRKGRKRSNGERVEEKEEAKRENIGRENQAEIGKGEQKRILMQREILPHHMQVGRTSERGARMGPS